MLFGLIGAAISFCSTAIAACCTTIASTCVATATAIKAATATAITMAGKLVSTGLRTMVTNVLKKISSGCTKIFGPVLGPIVNDILVKYIENTLKNIVMPQQKDEPEVIGYRIAEADKHSEWSKPENFESLEEYYEYLKQQIPDECIDTEEIKKNKIYYEAVSIATMAECLAKEYAIGVDEDFLFEIGRCGIEPNEIRAIIESYKLLGYENVSFSGYLHGTLSPYEKDRIEEAIKVNLKKYYPDKTDIELSLRLQKLEKCSVDNGHFLEENYKEQIKDIADHGEESRYLDKDFLEKNR